LLNKFDKQAHLGLLLTPILANGVHTCHTAIIIRQQLLQPPCLDIIPEHKSRLGANPHSGKQRRSNRIRIIGFKTPLDLHMVLAFAPGNAA